jgi:hypothetical protein
MIQAYDLGYRFKKNGINPIVIDVRENLKIQQLKKQRL